MDTFAEYLRYKRVFKKLPDKMIFNKSDWDNYYYHSTIKVRSLSEYIDVITSLRLACKDSEFDKLVYRGHSEASSDYKLVPSLGRYNVLLGRFENTIVEELITVRPNEFEKITSNFDLLAKMQHFELPTRLLDFSYNPLIALFFACCKKSKSKSGRVICTFDTSSYGSKQIVEKICSIHNYNDSETIPLDQLLGGVSQLRRYSLYTREPLMMKPKYSNDRIARQSAVFMIFPNEVIDRRSHMVVQSRKNNVCEEEYRLGFVIDELEKQRLEYLREEPDIYSENFSVNSTTLHKLFSYYSSKFPDFYSEKDFGINPRYHFLFRNRFTVGYKIQDLSREFIENSFISIIIEDKFKQKIIDELEAIGIDKSFVFPELIYTTEKIKNKYIKFP